MNTKSFSTLLLISYIFLTANLFAETEQVAQEISQDNAPQTIEQQPALEPAPAQTEPTQTTEPTQQEEVMVRPSAPNVESKAMANLVIEKNAPELRKTSPIEDQMKLQEAVIVLAKNGDTKGIDYILSKHKIDVNQKANYGMTPLLAAVQYGQYKTANFLIKKGADTLATTENGFDCLRFAVETQDIKLVKLFVKRKLRADTQDYIGETAFMVAMQKNDEKIIKLLSKQIKDMRLDLRNRDGKTLLMLAIENNNLDLAKKLVNLNANIWLLDKNGYDALSYAEKFNNKKMIDMLKKEIENSRKNNPQVEKWVRKSGPAQ